MRGLQMTRQPRSGRDRRRSRPAPEAGRGSGGGCSAGAEHGGARGGARRCGSDPGSDHHRGPQFADRLHRSLRLLQPDRDQRAVRRRHPAAQLGGSDRPDGLPAVAVPARPDARRRRLRRADDQRRQTATGSPTCPSPLAPTSTGSTSTTTPNLWVADPANSPIYAPDGLTGTARRAFNKVFVPYDAAKQNYAPLAARVIENERAGLARRAHGATFRSRLCPARRHHPAHHRCVPSAGLRPQPSGAVQDDLHAARRRPGSVRLDEHGRRPGHHGQPDPGRHHRARGRHHDEHELPRRCATRATPTCATS